MFCQNCGVSLNDGEKYCYKCGAEQAHADEFKKADEVKKDDENKLHFSSEAKKMTVETCIYTTILIAVIFGIYVLIKVLS